MGVNDIWLYIDVSTISFNVYAKCTNIEIVISNGDIIAPYIYSGSYTISNDIIRYIWIFRYINSGIIYIRIWNNIILYNRISSRIDCIVPTFIICISTIPCSMDVRKIISYNFISWLGSTYSSVYIINSIIYYIMPIFDNITISEIYRYICVYFECLIFYSVNNNRD